LRSLEIYEKDGNNQKTYFWVREKEQKCVNKEEIFQCKRSMK